MTQEQQDSALKVETNEIKQARLIQWKGAIEQELQALVVQASQIRTKIDTAKTNYKKHFYQKKFEKLSPRVRQMVAALQQIEGQQAALAQATLPPKEEQNVTTPEPSSVS